MTDDPSRRPNPLFLSLRKHLRGQPLGGRPGRGRVPLPAGPDGHLPQRLDHGRPTLPSERLHNGPERDRLHLQHHSHRHQPLLLHLPQPTLRPPVQPEEHLLLPGPHLGADRHLHRAQLLHRLAAVRPARLLLHLRADGQLLLHHLGGGGALPHPAAGGVLLLHAHLGARHPGEAPRQAREQAQGEAQRPAQLPDHVHGLRAVRRVLGAPQSHRPGRGHKPSEGRTQHPRVAVYHQLLHGVLQQLPERRHLRTPEPKLSQGVQDYPPVTVYSEVVSGGQLEVWHRGAQKQALARHHE